MTWNATVAAYAENYANQRLADCNLVHSGGPYGENLAEGSGTFTDPDLMILRFYDTAKQKRSGSYIGSLYA
ncbi:pathogenesis-related leaf protein 4-like protein [Tanacetum coccineum]|uniref:Pathogenesis-related leaf protein 4-like protein n=1 Tax=Tanacetum coccineum TaxID=301880 RepID=A0ABQ5DKV3_9ASTR